MKPSHKILLALIIALLLSPGVSSAKDYPFGVGEKMTFTVSALGMKAGFGVMEIAGEKTIDGVDCYHLVTTIESNTLFSSFFYISDRVDCYASKDNLLPIKYKKKEIEGDHSDKYTVYYNHEKNLARKNKDKALRMKPNSRDELSTFYYLRTLNLEPSMSFELPNCDGEKNRSFDVKIIGRETVTTTLGTFDALIVSVALNDAALIFGGKAEAILWISDDEDMSILKLESSFLEGAIKAEITSIER